jgi:hypothetical protein
MIVFNVELVLAFVGSVIQSSYKFDFLVSKIHCAEKKREVEIKTEKQEQQRC